MTLVTPLRFVSGVIGLWVAARLAVLTPDLLTPPAEADAPFGRVAGLRTSTGQGTFASLAARDSVNTLSDRAPAFRMGPSTAWVARVAARPLGSAPMLSPGFGSDPRRFSDRRAVSRAALAASDVAADPLLSPTGILAPATDTRTAIPSGSMVLAGADPAGVPPIRAAETRRLTGGAYLFRRGDGEGAALAAGGQLGGSQAGARVAWALNAAGPPRLAAVARVATPLDDARGAEAAAGIDLHPLPGRPLRLSVERRVDLGGRGRNAWSAYAAGGFWQPLKGGMVADGYAQAGIVGARSRDLFADGALRLGHRRELGGGRALTLGGGVWGAAQPRVSRLDVGPRAAVSLPLAGTSVTAAAEWRIRVRGDARPGSGLAFTLASDF